MAEPVPEQVPYPVDFDVEPCTTGRNRLTVAFRIILAIPQVILGSCSEGSLGGRGAISTGGGSWRADRQGRWA